VACNTRATTNRSATINSQAVALKCPFSIQTSAACMFLFNMSILFHPLSVQHPWENAGNGPLSALGIKLLIK
jgi:hypothetical protein